MAHDPVPRHLYVLEQNCAVGFIEPPGQRIVELADRIFLERFARPQGYARRIEGNRTGDGFHLLARTHGLQIADPGFVAEHRRGPDHLQAVEGDALGILRRDPQGGRFVGRRLHRARTPRALRVGHRVTGEQIVRPQMLVKIDHIVAEALADAVEQIGPHGETAHIRREIIR